MRMQWLALWVVCILTVYGCATRAYNPRPMEEVPFKERAQTQYEDGIRATAVVLSGEECKEVFGVDLYKRGIQPIWIEIENKKKEMAIFLPYGVDPDYFSPLEVPYMFRSGFSKAARSQMNQYFHEQQMDPFIAPGGVESGFVFTNLTRGTKAFNVDVLGEDGRIRSFTFFISVPGLPVSHSVVDFESLYSKDEIVKYDEKGLRKALESLPCCTTNNEGTEPGDPLNLVIISEGQDLHRALMRSGWNETAALSETSATEQKKSPFSGRDYRYAPVSPLYVYGRPQDAAFQKARETIRGRNQIRLWLTPMIFQGKNVWIGQISRNVAVRSTTKKGATYRIDPDVDDTRSYFLEDLWYSQMLLKYGYVKGVGEAPISEEPRRNLTGSPYFTDGYRTVIWLSSRPIALQDVRFVEWEIPPER
ncbi:MAG: LssY C-terminal domain-containing protein [Syntrophobacterales bacterium]